MQSKEEGTCLRCHQALSRGVVSAEGEPPRVGQFSERQSGTGIHASPQLVCNITSSFLSFPSWKWTKCFTDIRLEPKECLVLQFRSDRITAISCARPNTGSFNPHNNYIQLVPHFTNGQTDKQDQGIHPSKINSKDITKLGFEPEVNALDLPNLLMELILLV